MVKIRGEYWLLVIFPQEKADCQKHSNIHLLGPYSINPFLTLIFLPTIVRLLNLPFLGKIIEEMIDSK